MKFKLFIVLAFLTNIAYAKELVDLVSKIKEESFLIQESNGNSNYDENVNSFYKNYFVNGNNIFAYASDNHSKTLDCGFLNLKRQCYKSIYRIDEIKIDENIRCINIYGTHLLEQYEFIIQNTILFVNNNTTNNKWLILGNRVGVSSLQLLTYGLLNKQPIEDSFTNRCFNVAKINEWENSIKDIDKSMRYID